jgi:hypothetical protein
MSGFIKFSVRYRRDARLHGYLRSCCRRTINCISRPPVPKFRTDSCQGETFTCGFRGLPDEAVVAPDVTVVPDMAVLVVLLVGCADTILSFCFDNKGRRS